MNRMSGNHKFRIECRDRDWPMVAFVFMEDREKPLGRYCMHTAKTWRGVASEVFDIDAEKIAVGISVWWCGNKYVSTEGLGAREIEPFHSLDELANLADKLCQRAKDSLRREGGHARVGKVLHDHTSSWGEVIETAFLHIEDRAVSSGLGITQDRNTPLRMLDIGDAAEGEEFDLGEGFKLVRVANEREDDATDSGKKISLDIDGAAASPEKNDLEVTGGDSNGGGGGTVAFEEVRPWENATGRRSKKKGRKDGNSDHP